MREPGKDNLTPTARQPTACAVLERCGQQFLALKYIKLSRRQAGKSLGPLHLRLPWAPLFPFHQPQEVLKGPHFKKILFYFPKDSFIMGGGVHLSLKK